MRRVKSVCQSFRLKIGSQLQKQIKVSILTIFPDSNLLKIPKFQIPVIQALIALVNDPEPEHPLRADLAEEFLKDRKKFTKNAEEFTRKNSEKRPPE